MQQTEFAGKTYQEFFSAPTKREVVEKMDTRLKELKAKGHTYVRRVPKIGRNAPCPCGSEKKYKKCCISKAL